MLLAISHQTIYHYTAPVWLEPHMLHLQPNTSPFQTIHQYQLTVEPQPVLLSQMIDGEGNTAHVACFSGPTQSLIATSTFYAECRLNNPFSYLLYPFETTKFPFIYPDSVKAVLQPCLEPITGHPSVREYARQLAADAQYDTLGFLQLITQRIYAEYTYEYREFGKPYGPEDTLALKKGACRDYSLLMMEMCRMVGLAARFVSGYLLGNPHKEQYLHAWVEVYIPGGGWRGYDPTQGEVVADRHVVLAASAIPTNVTPVQGIYRGTATSKLETVVTVTETTGMQQSQLMF